ncbi:type IV pilus twitching motility protein PilT [bacterium]|nr:type IV pilus twitching motility protein PilT [bacterium]
MSYLLQILVENKGSDLHIQAGDPPRGRIRGELVTFPVEPLSPDDSRRLAGEVLPEPEKFAAFEKAREFDAAIALDGLGRFRVNLFFQRGRMGMVLRTIGTKIANIDDLKLPPVLKKICDADHGLILVTGATGSGKSTTLAAMIDYINSTQSSHIMTIEDPIEFVHQNKMSLVNQREVGADTPNFASALKYVLRQDPDVILIGEMRDIETVSVALTAAETGHLVFGTLHTQDAAQSIERILNLFPADKIQQVRMQLSLGLQAILCQRLVAKSDGAGRAAAIEILIATPLIRKLLMEGQTAKLPQAVQASQSEGMQTFNQAIVQLIQTGVISEADGLAASSKPDELKLNLKGIYSGTSGM